MSTDHNNDDIIQDQNCPMRGLLDDESIAWWMTWRKRNEIAAARHNSSSRRRAGGVNNNKQQQQRKKRKIVVDPDEDSHMFGDNEQEDDTEMEEEEEKKKKQKKEKGKKALLSSDLVESTDEDFKPMALNEIKVDEQAMHEDIRILIKVRWPSFLSCRFFFFSLLIFFGVVAGYHRWFCQTGRSV